MLDVRDCIRPAIEIAGMKQLAVAEKTGLTQQQLCDVMAKRRKLDANEFVNICQIVRMTPNELIALGVGECTDNI